MLKSRTSSAQASSNQRVDLDGRILGDHPSSSHLFGRTFSSQDGKTISEVSHRALLEQEGERLAVVAGIREMLGRHHVSPEALKRS
jgi:hypothetical protein